MKRKKRTRRSAEQASSTQGGDHLVTYPGGRAVRMTREAYDAAYDSLPRGTKVQHPGGWFVKGASIGDVFEFD